MSQNVILKRNQTKKNTFFKVLLMLKVAFNFIKNKMIIQGKSDLCFKKVLSIHTNTLFRSVEKNILLFQNDYFLLL